MVRCLNFDFIGTNPDESSEDVGTIQVPTSWRNVLQRPDTIEMLFEFYANTDPPRSSKAMEAVILLCSIRRSIFPTDKDRAEFLGRLMTGILVGQVAQDVVAYVDPLGDGEVVPVGGDELREGV